MGASDFLSDDPIEDGPLPPGWHRKLVFAKHKPSCELLHALGGLAFRQWRELVR